jgi:hypothetical protein
VVEKSEKRRPFGSLCKRKLDDNIKNFLKAHVETVAWIYLAWDRDIDDQYSGSKRQNTIRDERIFKLQTGAEYKDRSHITFATESTN